VIEKSRLSEGFLDISESCCCFLGPVERLRWVHFYHQGIQRLKDLSTLWNKMVVEVNEASKLMQLLCFVDAILLA